MQLDRTNVVIRARSLSEIGDLALILIRCYPVASILGFVLGALPWVILNLLLVGWIPLMQFGDDIHDEQMTAALHRYVFLMISLVIIQAPIAGVVTTNLIGRTVFEQHVSWRSAVGDLQATFWRWLWVLGVLRGPIPLMLVLATNWGQEFTVGREVLIPILFLVIVGFQRGRRPFMPEILLLERCPLRSRTPEIISAARRSSALHGPLAGELIGRFIAVAMMIGILFLAVLYSLGWIRGVMLGQWDWSLLVYLLFFPASLWAVAGLSVLIRFLSYLDARIRLEGWEVDLAVRAEAQRQFGETAGAMGVMRQAPAKQRVAGIASIVVGIMLWPLPQAVAEMPAGASLAAIAAVQGTAGESTDGPAISSPGSTAWYDAEQQELRPVAVETKLPEAQHRDSRWVPAPQRTAAPPPAIGGVNSTSIFGWILLGGLVCVLIGLLLYLFSKIEPEVVGTRHAAGGRGQDETDEQTLERMQHLPLEVRRTDVNLRAEAERLMNQGRLNDAIVLLFGHQLLLLDRGGILRLARGKTNGRYLRETRGNSPAAHRLFARSVAAFEASYFGGHTPRPEQFARLWAENAELEKIVAAKLRAAA